MAQTKFILDLIDTIQGAIQKLKKDKDIPSSHTGKLFTTFGPFKKELDRITDLPSKNESVNEAYGGLRVGSDIKMMGKKYKGQKGYIKEIIYKVKLDSGKMIDAKEGEFYNVG